MSCRVEVCIDSLYGAKVAKEGGAARVELCSALEIGGVTPSIALVKAVREVEGIELFVLIRPRGGDFLYDEGEIQTMLRDIEEVKMCGADGVVIGALTPEGDVDTSLCRDLIAAAGGMRVTFHRAFDMCRDRYSALRDIIGLGCERILTSGGAQTAMEGALELAELVRRADGAISIMAGSGVNSQNAAMICSLTGVTELHASARRPLYSAMQYRHSGVMMGSESKDEYLVKRTSLEEVRAIVESVR